MLRLTVLGLGLTLIPFVGWAIMTRMEQAVEAAGQYVPEGRRKTINLLEPGILRRIAIRITGVGHWLWLVVDQTGMVLDVLVQSRRNKQAFKLLLPNLLQRQC